MDLTSQTFTRALLALVRDDDPPRFPDTCDAMVFLNLGEELAEVRSWLATLAPQPGNGADIAAFNAMHELACAAENLTPIAAIWTNFALTTTGLTKLAPDDLNQRLAALTADATELALSERCHSGRTWTVGPMSPSQIDAILVVAAPDPVSLEARLRAAVGDLSAAGIREVRRAQWVSHVRQTHRIKPAS